ncbi:MAG TPA: EAL domain-containing protein, partial [Clostridiaceae bacterium]|nr:EAL domain-containing protein [Clostridiaceae bacterium]
MNYLRKTKRIINFRYISWVIYFTSYAGLLLISVLPLFDNDTNLLTSNPELFYWLLRVLTVSVGVNFVLQYFIFRRHDQAFFEFDKSMSDVQMEILSPEEVSKKMDMMTLSTALNHLLKKLKEKNERLKDEIEKNHRLSENISEFYRQMRTLRDAELIFDFFEYDINGCYFTFISGMITALSGESEATEITAEDLFKNFQFSIGLKDYYKHVERCLEEDCDMNFECSVQGKDDGIHWLKFWGRLTQDKTRITGAVTDITREVNIRIAEKERIIHDNITGFYNRNALSEVGGKAIAECKEDKHVVFVYIGLTKYQEFQERFGMVSGNNYIRVCAEVMKKFITKDMIPIRWWGSDFLIIVKGVKDLKEFEKEAADVADKIGKHVGDVDGIATTFPMVMGYAASKIHGKTPPELLEFAAFAEHEALREVAMSPNEFNFERFEKAHLASLRRTLIKDIIDKNQLSVVFQPIVSLRTGELYGFEALSRPTNPAYNNILELIDDAEASGHYVILEKRMVYNALDAYMARDPKYKDYYLFINTAPYATLDEKDYNDIRDRYFNHMKVVFEVIERNRIDSDEINLRRSIVKKAGAKFALDDFGSGYSNHLALLALEPDIIKIDRELVRGINADLRKQHILEDIISYARYRGTRVLGEGVETQEELETLCRMGVDYVQGYFTGVPDKKLTEPDIRAKQIIKGIIRNKNIDLRQLYIIMEKSFAIISGDYAKYFSITVYLMIKLAKRLNIDEDRFTSLIITTIFHGIG